MALTNVGRLLFQNQIKTNATRVQLLLEDVLGGEVISTRETAVGIGAIVFNDANASLGLTLDANKTIAVEKLVSADVTYVVGLKLTNLDGSLDYMQVDFENVYSFIANGNFTITLLTVSFL
jgi:hypothetical protein